MNYVNYSVTDEVLVRKYHLLYRETTNSEWSQICKESNKIAVRESAIVSSLLAPQNVGFSRAHGRIVERIIIINMIGSHTLLRRRDEQQRTRCVYTKKKKKYLRETAIMVVRAYATGTSGPQFRRIINDVVRKRDDMNESACGLRSGETV